MDLNVKLEKMKNEETSGALMIVFDIMNFVATPFRLIIELVAKLSTIAQIILMIFVSPIIICLYYFSFRNKNKENEKQLFFFHFFFSRKMIIFNLYFAVRSTTSLISNKS